MHIIHNGMVHEVTDTINQHRQYRTILGKSGNRMYMLIPETIFYFTSSNVNYGPAVYMVQKHSDGIFRTSIFTNSGLICWGNLKTENLSPHELVSLFWNSKFEFMVDEHMGTVLYMFEQSTVKRLVKRKSLLSTRRVTRRGRRIC